MWVLLDDVADVKYVDFAFAHTFTSLTLFSMGTGVTKVWNLTQALWEKNIDGD